MIKNKDEEIRYLKEELRKYENNQPSSYRRNNTPSPTKEDLLKIQKLEEQLDTASKELRNLKLQL